MEVIEVKNYKGHIRNWKDLCNELDIDLNLTRKEREKQIITKGYTKWKEDIGNHLYGSFSFVIETEDYIFGIRDQFGTIPFYYYLTEDNELLHGTKIKDFINHPKFNKELNKDMLQIYLSLTYVAGENTFFKGVKKLMPGKYLIYKNKELSINTYWEPTFDPDNSKTIEEYADEIHSTMQTIMQEIKDENETAESFLSGGVDSSYVLAMSDITTANTCGYEEKQYDESPLAKKTADYFYKRLNKALITPEEYFSIVPSVMKNMEQPLADASAIVFALSCRKVSLHTRLCYSGEGVDELFAGYNAYKNAYKYRNKLKNTYIGNTNIMNEEEKKLLLKEYNPDIKPIDLATNIYNKMTNYSPLSKMQNIDIQLWLEGDIYLNVAKMSEINNLEVRMPLTDIRIFNIASKLPDEYKINSKQNKIAFRLCASKVLPEEIAYRKKLGFVVPIRYWLADSKYNENIIKMITSPLSEKFFNYDEIEKLMLDYLQGNNDLWRIIWTIYTFLVWYKEYFPEDKACLDERI